MHIAYHFCGGAVTVHAPRQVGRAAESFLVHKVTPAADTLTDEIAKRRDIQHGEQVHLADLRDDAAAQHAADDAAVNAEAALFDVEDFHRVRDVLVARVEDDVVKTRADDATEQAGDDGIEPGGLY